MQKQTLSFCPTCYKKIPAIVYFENDKIWMHKKCSSHGETKALIEPDASYYMQCALASSQMIYPAYNIEITSRCNLRCKYCYHPRNAFPDPTKEDIIQEAATYAQYGPIVFIGGEPCLRDDLVELVGKVQQLGPKVEIVTNGTKYPDKRLDELLPLITDGRTCRINLSIHKEADGRDIDLMNRLRKRGIKLESILIVVENEKQVIDAIRFGLDNADVTEALRIKAATCIWNEQKPTEYLFVSDLIKIAEKNFDCKPIWWRNNKTSFFNMQIGPLMTMMVTWYNVKNIDLLDINCPPLLKAYNGQIDNVVTADIINEGIDRGWLNGMRFKRGEE